MIGHFLLLLFPPTESSSIEVSTSEGKMIDFAMLHMSAKH